MLIKVHRELSTLSQSTVKDSRKDENGQKKARNEHFFSGAHTALAAVDREVAVSSKYCYNALCLASTQHPNESLSHFFENLMSSKAIKEKQNNAKQLNFFRTHSTAAVVVSICLI